MIFRDAMAEDGRQVEERRGASGREQLAGPVERDVEKIPIAQISVAAEDSDHFIVDGENESA